MTETPKADIHIHTWEPNGTAKEGKILYAILTCKCGKRRRVAVKL